MASGGQTLNAADADQPAGTVVHRHLRALQRRLDRELAALAQGFTPASVHRARICARRLRVLLRVFAPQFAAREAKRYRRALKHLARQLEPLREADVTRAALLSLTEDPQLPRDDRTQKLILRATRERAIAAQELRAAILTPQWTERSAELRRLANGAALVTPTRETFGVIVQRLKQRLRRRLTRALHRTGQRNRELHQLRLEIKVIRYLLEEFPSAAEEGSATENKQLRQLQNCLGELHDAWRLNKRLRRELRPRRAARKVRAKLGRQRGRMRHELRRRRAALLRQWADETAASR